MKFKKRIFTIVLCICMLLIFCFPVNADVYTATIVFLGDSIANGAVLPDKRRLTFVFLIGRR